MAHSKQAKKRIRQNEKRRLANKDTASSMRTYFKKLMTAVSSGNREEAASLLPETLSKIDKAAKRNVIHDNAAARKKGQAMRAFGKMASS